MLRRMFVGASLLAMAAAANAGTLEEDAKAFGTREHVSHVSMNASGSKLAMIAAGKGSESVLVVADLASGEMLNLTKSDGRPQALQTCTFAGDSQIVCEHFGSERYDNKLVGFSGLFAISADGKVMRYLRPKGHDEGATLRQSDGDVIDWLPDSNGSVLMARQYIADANTTGTMLARSTQGLGVDRIDLATLKSSKVEPPRPGASGYMTDGRGNVRLMFLPKEDRRELLTGDVRIRYRTKKSDKWEDLPTGWTPLAVDADSDSLLALKEQNGRKALFRLALDGSGSATLIGADPKVDIDDVVRLGPGQPVIGYTFADEQRHVVYFDPQYQKLQSALGKAIPNQPQISFYGGTRDGQKLLLLARGDTHAGTFYRFDRATKQLSEIIQVRPDLAGRQLAQMKPIVVPAADGAGIPAYLTLPPGSDGKNLPAIVLPHGGPSARDEWGFHWLPQFLAARGYAVIQPNFRGSEGYGDAWLVDNGFKSWRTAIGDVTAAAKYLVAQGIADPARLAILGWSYGGYAALQSAAVEPKLYKAAVAIAPLTDMAAWRDESRGFTNFEIMKRFVGDGPYVREGSPLQNVSAINVPVFLAHGTEDANVSVSHSDRMAAALKSAGKRVEYVKFDSLDHYLDDSEARTEMLTRIGRFLEASLKP